MGKDELLRTSGLVKRHAKGNHGGKFGKTDNPGFDIQNGLSPKSGKALSGRFMRELGMSTAVKGSMVPLLLTP